MHYIGFLDADFATPFEEFKRLLEIVETEDYDIIFGSRVKLKGWQIETKSHSALVFEDRFNHNRYLIQTRNLRYPMRV